MIEWLTYYPQRTVCKSNQIYLPFTFHLFLLLIGQRLLFRSKPLVLLHDHYCLKELQHLQSEYNAHKTKLEDLLSLLLPMSLLVAHHLLAALQHRHLMGYSPVFDSRQSSCLVIVLVILRSGWLFCRPSFC
jgi:hypothetical protein